MTRIRQWAVALAFAAALALSFSSLASVASADPGDGGFSQRSARPTMTASAADPGDGGW